jgi:uncharacterized membrane protein (UPF0127 family)
MPSNETAKIKSALKRSIWVIVLGVFVLVTSYVLIAGIFHHDSGTVNSNLNSKNYTLTVGGTQAGELKKDATPHGRTYYLSAATSEADQERGLSGTPSLADDRGMLFVDSSVGERCFWMKDMRYALDIIWLDNGKKVVHIEKNLSPSTYPKAYCAQAQYVIELNAGQADKSGLSLGQVVSF